MRDNNKVYYSAFAYQQKRFDLISLVEEEEERKIYKLKSKGFYLSHASSCKVV